MKSRLPALDVDLKVEYVGYQVVVTGSGHNFVVKVPTLLAAIRLARMLWPVRKRFPAGYGFDVEWRGIRLPVRKAS